MSPIAQYILGLVVCQVLPEGHATEGDVRNLTQPLTSTPFPPPLPLLPLLFDNIK